MTEKRLAPTDRRKQILDRATDMAAETGFFSLTKEAVARSLGVSPALINQYYGTVTGLRYHVMANAVATGRLPIIAEGLVNRDPQALCAPMELKEKALAAVTR